MIKLKKFNYLYFYILALIISIVSFLLFGEKSLTFLILINLIILILFLIKNIRNDFFNLSNLFLINYLAYVLYIPIKLINYNYKGEIGYYLSGDRFLASKIVLICGIVASVSYILGKYIFNLLKYDEFKGNNKILKTVILMKKKFEFILNVNIFTYFLIISGFILFIIGIYKQGGIQYLFSKYVWDSENLKEVGIMTTGVQIAFTGITISFYNFVSQKDFSFIKILKWPVLYITIFISIIKFIQGGRIQILMGLITLILIYNYKYKKIKLKYILLFILLGVLLLGYVGYYRDYKILIPNNISTLLPYLFGGSAGMEYILNSYTNFTSMNLINGGHMSYLFGTTLLDGIIFLIPRFILPNKDNLLFTNRKLNELNNIEVISPVGGLNLAAQNLINGYIIYTIVFMIVLGFIFSWLNKYRNSKYGMLLYCMVIPYLVISLVRNPIFYTIKEVVQFCILPYLIFVFLKLGDYDEKASF